MRLALVVLYALRGLLFLTLVAFVLAYGVWEILFAVPAVAILQVLLPEMWGLVQQRQVHAE